MSVDIASESSQIRLSTGEGVREGILTTSASSATKVPAPFLPLRAAIAPGNRANGAPGMVTIGAGVRLLFFCEGVLDSVGYSPVSLATLSNYHALLPDS